MRFSNVVTPVGGAYGTAVGAWSGTSGLMPEKVFGVFRNSFTRTATITAASFVRGNPVVLATASNNGYDLVHPSTMNQLVNELFVGVVADYPDTTAAKTGVWQPEDFGIVQTYGRCDNAVVANATVTQAAMLMLSPDTGSQLITATPLFAASAGTSTTANTQRTGIAGLAILLETLATSSAAGTAAASVWLRCM